MTDQGEAEKQVETKEEVEKAILTAVATGRVEGEEENELKKTQVQLVDTQERQKSSGPKSASSKKSLGSNKMRRPVSKQKEKLTPLFEAVSQRYIPLEALAEFNERRMYWRYKDVGGGTALHRLCANTSCTVKHFDVCRDVLIELNIGEIRDDEGKTALHYVAINPSATPELVNAVAALWSGATRAISSKAEKVEHRRDTPLHAACRSSITPASVISALAQLDKDVCLFEDQDGNTPLAVLCHNLDNDPHDYGGTGPTRRRKTTVYSFDQDATRLERLVALGDYQPQAARCQNLRGQTALHLLCLKTNSVEAITYIGRLFPDAAKTQDYASREDAILAATIREDSIEIIDGLPMTADQDDGAAETAAQTATHAQKNSLLQEHTQKNSSFLQENSKDTTRPSSTRKRRKSSTLAGASKRVSRMFGNVSNLIAMTPTAQSKILDAGATPLHYLCRRETKFQPAVIEAIGNIYPGAALIRTHDRGYTPLHILFMNEHNANYNNLKTLLNFGPEAIEIMDRRHRTPVDGCPPWLVDRLSPQLMALFPKLALSPIRSCSYCLLHYVCLKEAELVDAAVEHMYEMLHTNPPLAVYLVLPEVSRECLASTRTIVNLVDKIFTAPSVVAYLLVEITLAFLMVFAFFNMCLRIQEERHRPISGIFVYEICIIALHGLVLSSFKFFQARALYRHDRLRHFFTIWNVVDLLSVVLFVATLFSGLYDRANSFRVIAAFSQLIIPFRLLRIVKGLNKSIGAFVLCLTNIVIGVAPFLFTFSLVIVSFSQVFHVLLADFGARENTQLALDGSVFLENPFTSPLGSLYQVILIVLVGDFERDLFENDLAAILVCLMLLVLVVVLLNVLIAVVSDTYERTLTNAEPIYLRSRLETATELQQVLPAWVFDPHESRILLFVSIIFFPVTTLWLFSLYFTRLFQGKRIAQELAPRRLLAYAKARGHEDEEEVQTANNARAPFDLLRRDLQTGLKKLQDELLLRLLTLENELKVTVEHELAHALEILDSEFKELKTDKEYKDILTKQNNTLDRLITNLSNPIDHLPADLRRRVDRERGVPDLDDDNADFDPLLSFSQCAQDFNPNRYSC